MPLILPGNVASATASTTYDVDNSCRFNDGDSAYMHKTCGSAFDTDKWTISLWCKRGALGIETRLVSCDNDDGSDDDCLKFQATDQLEFTIYDGGYTGTLKTNAVYRDISAWYHIVAVWDSGNATAGNRMRLYVNGTEVTSFATDTNPAEDANATFGNTSHPIEIGRRGTNGTQYWDGYLAEVAVCDGQAYTASDFGEFDEDSPTIWKPKDVSGLTFGTSGFYLDFEASDNLGNDANGGTDWTETNLDATDQATDTPTNNFATMNPLDNYYANSTFSEGNCTIVQGSSTYAHNLSTIAVTAGKWYAEAKLTTDSEHALVGITDTPAISVLVKILGSAAHDYSIKQANGDLFNNVGDDPSNDATNYAAAYAQNDIIGIALDCDNNKLYFSKGGAWSDGSGSWDSTTFNASVGAITITAPASTDNGHYFFASGDYGGAVCNWEWNFGGCPPNTISSGNADADGYGNFEYAVPSGYYALCTKNIGAYGG